MDRRGFMLGLSAARAAGQARGRSATFEGQAAFVVANDTLELTVMAEGGAFARLVRHEGPGRLNPLWEPARAAREDGSQNRFGPSLGHFTCVDGFGSPTPAERAAGFPSHGEAHLRPWEVRLEGRSNGVSTLTLAAMLPLGHETFTRTIRMADGESVIQVHATLESQLAFDRPISWTEHATIGAPFWEADTTVVDLAGGRAMTRPAGAGPSADSRLAPGREFTWPMAPAASGGMVSLRTAPRAGGSAEIVTVLLDPAREQAFVTALHPLRRLVFGYFFPTADYPWLQIWDNGATLRQMARGLEFGTQPFGQSRRQSVDLHSLLGAPTYRWLPAMSKIETRFLMFYAETPEGFQKADDARLDGGRLVLTDGRTGRQLTLAASLGL